MFVLKILKFYKLVVVSLWLEMLRSLTCVLAVTITAAVGEDYLRDATQKGLDYGMVTVFFSSFFTNKRKNLQKLKATIVS